MKEKKEEWIETIHHTDGTSSRIHYQGEPITHEDFIQRTRSMRYNMPVKHEKIESRFEILDL